MTASSEYLNLFYLSEIVMFDYTMNHVQQSVCNVNSNDVDFVVIQCIY